ncbi:MAG: 30S ribosomal protein S12 methylthiotransferase RimO [Dermatophilaceae bacterium]
MTSITPRRVALVTLGCTRNEVDSEELAGRLSAGGWELVEDAADADVAVVNTCGFIEQAKKDSIDVLLEASELKASGRTQAVVAVGCLAERYGRELAEELPEADAVLGFDSYADLSGTLRAILDGARPASHVPSDRRRLLPLTPTERRVAVADVAVPGLGAAPGQAPAGGADAAYGAGADALLRARAPRSGPSVVRARLDQRPWAPLKIASGCDRRCAFCAIPMFRGAFVSRHPDDVVAEAHWLADRGVREAFLVSENSTSYGKDLGDLAAMEKLLPRLAEVEGLDWIRVSYLQPAEIRPGLLEAIVATPKVVPWLDVSFQHSSPAVLRRMRRFGSSSAFLDLIDRIRALAPEAAIRSNVVVGFPGETAADVEELAAFLTAARLDVVGVFGYSDEDGTEGATLPDKIDAGEIADRVAELTDLVEELTAQRAAERIGSSIDVLIEELSAEDGLAIGRASIQGPDIDGQTTLPLTPDLAVGRIVAARVVGSEGVDLQALPR